MCLAVEAQHRGEGTYHACFTITEAGPYSVSVGVEGEQGCRVFNNMCRAGPLSLPQCRVVSVDTCLVAGQTGELRLQRRDK